MRISLLFSLLLCAAAALAQAPQKKAATSKAKTNSGRAAVTLIDMETGPCRGYCPVYKISVTTAGQLNYVGQRFVAQKGKKTVKLTAEELERLRAKITEVNLWQYPSDIKTDIADAPFVTLTVYEGKKSKKVTGSVDRPQPILDLEELIKSIAEAHGLKIREGVPPKNDVQPAKGKRRTADEGR